MSHNIILIRNNERERERERERKRESERERVIASQNFIFKERNLSYVKSPSAIVNNSSRL